MCPKERGLEQKACHLCLLITFITVFRATFNALDTDMPSLFRDAI